MPSTIVTGSRRALTTFIAVMLAITVGCSTASRLTHEDEAAIRATAAAYVDAWLRDDTTGVLATLTPDAVLLPPGRLPVTGQPAIEQFWWPRDGSQTRIHAFDWSLEEVMGSRAAAYTRGLSTLAWTYDKDTLHIEQTVRSTNLTIFQYGSDGRWRIARQMWGPPLKE